MACKESSGAGMAGRQNIDASQWMSQWAQMNFDMMQSALKNVSPMMTAWTDWSQSWMPPQWRDLSNSMATTMWPGMNRACCDIPEAGCPPRCVCTLTWQASPGEVRKATIEIRNTSKDPITYQLVPTAFQVCDKVIDLMPAVNPPSLTADPGQTVTATVEVPVGEQFHPGATYHAEILVRGKYERCVRLELQMRCDQEEVCRFDHGDIPVRVRADDWFRHFQCSEPCFEPIQRSTNIGGTGDPLKQAKPGVEHGKAKAR